MSILSVDNISPIGSGTSVTINNAATLVLTNANSTGVITATSFVGNLTGNVTGTASANAVLTGSTNNTLVTVTGANAITGEANLKFDGTNLDIDSDSGHLRIGDDQDLDLYHNGSNGYLKNSTGQQLYRSGTHTFENAAGSTEYLRITSEGKLGINYNSPVTIIHALGNSNVGTSVTMTLQSHDTANATAGVNLLARRNDNVNETCKIQAASGGQNSVDLQFHTNSGEKLRITSAGNVGIGTDNPSQTLTIFGASSSGLRISKSGVLAYDHTFDGSTYTIANNNGSAGIPLVIGTKTAGGESLRISSDGYVTTPSQPSFAAYINGMTAQSQNTGTQIMPFNATNTNVGGHFKTSGTDQYKFVAPVAGNYYFSLSQNHSSRVDTRILKNGVDYHGGESETSSMNWWDHHHLSCVIPLAAGDKVHCTTNNQDGGGKRAWNSGYWESFSGFLIG